jgi:hypothetical protein
VEGRGRGEIRGTVLEFGRRDSGKPRKYLARRVLFRPRFELQYREGKEKYKMENIKNMVRLEKRTRYRWYGGDYSRQNHILNLSELRGLL